MMNNISITIQVILSVFGGITCIAGGLTAIMKLFNPYKKLKEKVEDHENKLAGDFDKIQEMDKSIKAIEDSNKVICKSLLVLLNHEITGNGIDRLKQQRDELEQYLINLIER